ncbi:MAG: hypothetical protein J7574_03090 [Flavobacterium sp.]|uniref:hypothetical protein n=1 Tax=Flavobacterium sp. TaxID=239 RepID=UPI001B19D0BE|nr:hypothetical protein [Flavobacterium sp.]MBO9583125.1 hypothetical protein [Flavobacterium sp.]
MIQILKYLILIRFRKILPKDDHLGIILLLLFYATVVYFLNRIFPKYPYLFLVFALELVFSHQNRKDFDLLKKNRKYRLLLILEYLIYSFPFLLVYFVNKRFDVFFIHLSILLLLILLPKVEYGTFKYPFRLIDPFWHISFRKNKLIIFIPLVIFLNFLGSEYHNENLNISTLLIVSIVSSWSSFNREEHIHLKMNTFNPKKYLLKQIQATLTNTFILNIALIICFIIFKKWNLLLFIPIVFVFPLISILFKYTFFSNPLLQQIFFAFFIGTAQTGLPFLVLPFLYYKSIKTINNLKNVED